MSRNHFDAEKYEEAVTVVFRRIFASLIETGMDEDEAEDEANARAEAEIDQRMHDAADDEAGDRYYTNRLFAAA